MELFEKNRRGIYVYFKNFKDLKKIEKYGNFISHSKRGKYACLYVDEKRLPKIVSELETKKFVKNVVVSEFSNLEFSLEEAREMFI